MTILNFIDLFSSLQLRNFIDFCAIYSFLQKLIFLHDVGLHLPQIEIPPMLCSSLLKVSRRTQGVSQFEINFSTSFNSLKILSSVSSIVFANQRHLVGKNLTFWFFMYRQDFPDFSFSRKMTHEPIFFRYIHEKNKEKTFWLTIFSLQFSPYVLMVMAIQVQDHKSAQKQKNSSAVSCG